MDDLERIASLRRMKLAAAALLAVAAIIFVIAKANDDGHGAWGYVRAFAEAAMVGALADWFAVTALFRHPLGLKIPHTAIIPTRKDQIGRSLGEFVESNFMSSDIIGERLKNAHIGQRLGVWMAHADNAARAGDGAADVLRGALEVLDDQQVQEGIASVVESRIRATEIAPLMGRAIDIAVTGGHHERLLDAILTGLNGFLQDNRGTFRQRLEQESPWWVPESIDDRLFAKFYDAINRFLADIGHDQNHEVRRSIQQRVISFGERLKTDPDMMAKGEELKNELLAHPDVRAWIDSLWNETKHGLVAATAEPNSELRRRIAATFSQLGIRLQSDPTLQHKIDNWVERALAYVIENYRSEVSDLIESTVAHWDGDATSRKMELQVGRDLQFIRINGTIVGGLAGLVIFAVSQAFF